MALTHYDREEETLIAYFKQMLSEEVEALNEQERGESEEERVSPQAQMTAGPENAVPEERAEPSTVESASAPVSAESVEEAANRAMIEAQEAQEAAAARDTPEVQAAEVAETSSDTTEGAETAETAAEYAGETDEADEETDAEYPEDEYEAEAYEHDEEEYDYTPRLQPELAVESEPERPYATPSSLQTLLEQVPAPAVKTAEETATVTVAETVTETAVETAPVTEEVTSKVEEDTQVVQAKAVEPPVRPEGLEWENIETPDEFQALFFLARGVRFAVPLVDLGGIYECSNVTSLFGKPAWYKGISDVRGRKINVVDTLKWVKPDVKEDSEFKYIILLGDSLWSICCDELEGNRYLNKENVKWRQNAGNRPWLAGIVKKEMCALLHVNALVTMFGKGFDLKTLQDEQINES